jgi:hypothetical protein
VKIIDIEMLSISGAASAGVVCRISWRTHAPASALAPRATPHRSSSRGALAAALASNAQRAVSNVALERGINDS